jgi:hypothetical protein
MKYMIIDVEGLNLIVDHVEYHLSFPAKLGNPNYDQFLVDAKLTDKQVKELKPNVWYDFPEGDK